MPRALSLLHGSHEINLEREFVKTANDKIDRSLLKRKWQGGSEDL